jgi:tetratricopeptide (TPR) repeat protein
MNDQGEYTRLIQEGERLRNANNPRAAIRAYGEAYDIAGPQNRTVAHMLGVSHLMAGEYGSALIWLNTARQDACDIEAGNIYRDIAEVYRQQGDLEQATEAVIKSLKLLPEGSQDYGATIGFLARIELQQGRRQMRIALWDFAEAERILGKSGSRRKRLYNRLHWAAALSVMHRPVSARIVAVLGLWSAWRYGATAHRVRAIVLLVGGHRADTYLRNRREERR